ncbi:hypothetical protein ASPCADRAFT_210863 [Aspergillus carbonarius ITEM 5010]|uniref:F-box domain-containing protein n=1 Tax=Aspergillus carbonarius (strain ITEM 5010) TaxID=602072 RepID=A0A1R3RBZ1_ASPC5|nr:hypothetical protein ASPCADRAFT_210863 [Aspergillus carbonarius ITEM 5010]
MTSLSHLPLELLRWVAAYLDTPRDIGHFMQTTKRLYHALHPFLCEFNVRHEESSALLWAAREGHARLVGQLLAAGANIAAYVPPAPLPRGRDEEQDGAKGGIDPWATKNPLLHAAQGRHTEVLQTLLTETRSGQAALPAQLRSVLHWALRQHDAELVELMLAHQAPLNPATKQRAARSALGVAVGAGYNAILPRLLTLGARPGVEEYPCPVQQAICTNQPDLVRLLLDHGLPLHSDEGLCHIAHEDNRAMLRLLLEYGIDLNLYGCAALPVAIRDGHYEMAKLLIDHRAPTDILFTLYPPCQIPLGPVFTAMGFAILYDRLDILQLLLDRGTRPSQEDINLAKKRKLEEAVALLGPFVEEDQPRACYMELHINIAFMEKKSQDPNMEQIYFTESIVDISGTRHPDPLIGENNEWLIQDWEWDM